VRKDIKKNKKFDPQFKSDFKNERKNKDQIYRYVRTAQKDESAILPSEASITRDWSPKIGDETPVQTKKYNPTGNNIPMLSAGFIGNTNTINDNGNADVVAGQLNKLFSINSDASIMLKGSTPAPSTDQNKTGDYGGYTIDGATSPSFTLKQLLDGRARAGRSLLINSGVTAAGRLTISSSHQYGGSYGVISKPNLLKK